MTSFEYQKKLLQYLESQIPWGLKKSYESWKLRYGYSHSEMGILYEQFWKPLRFLVLWYDLKKLADALEYANFSLVCNKRETLDSLTDKQNLLYVTREIERLLGK